MQSSTPSAWWRAHITAPSTVLFLALLASQAGVLVLSPILVQVATEFDVSTAVAGQLRMISGLVAGGVALAFGRFGRGVALRDLLLAGAGLLAAGSLMSAASPNLLLLAIAQVPIGVAVALLVSAGSAAAGEWAPGRGRRVLSWTLIGPASAWVIGMPAVGLVAQVNWRAGFLVLPFVASGIVAGALSLCRKDVLPAARPLVHVQDLVRDPLLRFWMLAELLAASAWVGTLVFAGALFVESYATEPQVTGVVLALAALAYIPGNFLAARLLRDRRSVDLLPWLAGAACVAVGLLGTTRPSVPVSLGFLAILAFLVGGRTLAAGALALATDPGRRLAVMGVRTAATQFGYFLGAAIGGLALAAGGYPVLGLVFGSFFLAATLVLLRLRAVTAVAAA